ncbi:hypothetical protein [Mycoplasma suis]|uniref:hypothetical protein n=1 Tax=Mycoplasma suis TaxID=57372 RepID=UPI000304FBA0|nr:hypothetical protein [Mycoplasma suis]
MWDKYFLVNGGGIFDSFRRSTGFGEKIFIGCGVMVVLASLATLIFALANISISTKEGLKELKAVSFALCVPVFGAIAAAFVLFHFLVTKNYNNTQDSLRRIPFVNNLLNSYLQIFIKREEKNLKKANFVDSSFLDSPKKLKENF